MNRGASDIDIEGPVETLLGDGADIEMIDIGEFPGVSLNAGYVLADSLDGLVKLSAIRQNYQKSPTSICH